MKPIYTISITMVLIAAYIYITPECIKDYRKARSGEKTIASNIINRRSSYYTHTLDIDGDGEDELYHSHVMGYPNKQEVSLSEPFQNHYFRLFYGDIMAPRDYIFFGAYYDKTSRIYCFRFLVYHNGKLLLKDVDNRQNHRRSIAVTGTENIINPKFGMDFLLPVSVDLDKDGKPELLVIMKQQHEAAPGTIICLDPETGKCRWDYRIGPVIIDVQSADMDNNGENELILSTYAAVNGVRFNSIEDNYSCIVTLNAYGSKLWHKKIGPGFTFARPVIHDLDNDKKPEIITAIEAHARLEHMQGDIMVLDGINGNIKNRFSIFGLSFSRPLIYKSSRGIRIYAGDSMGKIRMFDRNLNLMASRQLKKKTHTQVLKTSHPSSPWDFLLAYSQGELSAFDWDLKQNVFNTAFPPPIRLHDMLPPVILLPIKTHTGHHALLRSNALYLISQTGSSFIHNLWHSGLLLSLAFFLALTGLSVYFICVYRRSRLMDGLSGGNGASLQSLEVIQSITHRIKNSIAKVTWTAEKIKRSVQTDSNADCARLAGILAENAKTIRRQSDNILKLVQIQELKIKKIALKPLLEERVRHYRTMVEEHIDIEFEMDEAITVYLDEALFKEALVNLLDNAVEAMPEGGTLRLAALLEISAENPHRGKALIEVEDSGHGIDEDELDRIFTPFYTGKEKGSGIGLPICKHIIENHGGTIDVHSVKGLGTRIAIYLPVKRKFWF